MPDMEQLTTRDLAVAIAKDRDDPDSLRKAMHRVQHIDKSGLYKLVGVRSGPEKVGRGGARTYADKAIPWTKIMSSMLDYEFGIQIMQTCVMAIIIEEAQSDQDLIERARIGNPDLILILPYIHTTIKIDEEGNEMTVPEPTAMPRIITNSDKIPDWRSGKFINLTRALSGT